MDEIDIGGELLKMEAHQIVNSDLANATRFAKQHGADVRFTTEKGWFVWDAYRWIANTSLAMQKAKDTARSIFEELLAADPARQKEVFKWARQSQDLRRIMAMLSLAQSEPGIAVRLAEFDADPWRLNVDNGTVNLRTGVLEPHKPENLCSKIVPVTYDPAARCELWQSFLRRVMGGNENLISYLQRAVGYSLAGDTSEQCLFFVYGGGANGKSVFLETIKSLTGSYGLNTTIETFILKQGGGIPNDIARLAGARFVSVSETAEGQRLHEPLVKDLTGGDTITARFLHREFFEFNPQFKLWVRGNHKPVIRGTDDGIWRRIHLVPFNVQIPEDERDPALIEKLKNELPGILVWAVQGCLQWQKTGLQPPDEVKAAVREYRAESDTLGAFLGECCLEGSAFQMSAKSAYAAYRTWAEKSGEHPTSQKRFGSAMSERGFDRKRLGGGYLYRGIGLSVNDENDCEPKTEFSPHTRAREENNLELGSHRSQGSRDKCSPCGRASSCMVGEADYMRYLCEGPFVREAEQK